MLIVAPIIIITTLPEDEREILDVLNIIFGFAGWIVAILVWAYKEEIEKWLRINKPTPEQQQYHTTFLNDNVYRQLSRLYIREDHNRLLVFMIPNNPPSSNLTPIQYALPHMKIGLKHLQHSEYREIYDLWKKLENERREYNELTNTIKQTISSKVVSVMRDKFPEFVEYDGYGTKKSYRSKNVADTLYYFSIERYRKAKMPEFRIEISQFGNDVFQIMNSGTLMQSPNKDDLNIDELRETLVSICTELNLEARFNDLYYKHLAVADTMTQFSEILKEKIVNMIDAGTIIKGKCEGCP